jgi:hypothetical protein
VVPGSDVLRQAAPREKTKSDAPESSSHKLQGVFSNQWPLSIARTGPADLVLGKADRPSPNRLGCYMFLSCIKYRGKRRHILDR